jgi:gliding motility-associated lipoprotein GldD
MRNKISRENELLRKVNFSFLRSSVVILAALFAVCLISSCGDDDENTIAPKPRAYYRLSFPEKKYVEYDSSAAYKFEIPVYSSIELRKGPDAKTGWLNLNFPSLNATINFTYKTIEDDSDITANLEETYKYVSKHQVKSSGIEEEVIEKKSKKVYGLIYDIGGNAASPLQFFLTDSTQHFIRGALYFNAVPNIDSIKPAMEFIRKDIYHLIETFEWKNNATASKSSK